MADRHEALRAAFRLHPTHTAVELSRAAGYRGPQYQKLRDLGWAPVRLVPAHGTMAMAQRKCRCSACLEAGANALKAYRVKRSLAVPERVHGTANGYSNYLCRCEPCRAAGSVSNRKNAEKRKKGVAA